MGKDGVVKNIAVVCFCNTQMVRNKSVLETRHLNNPTLAVWGNGRDATAACRKHATTQLIIVAYLRYACLAGSRYTPHCAPLRYADVGLLKYRASGTRGKTELTAARVS